MSQRTVTKWWKHLKDSDVINLKKNLGATSTFQAPEG
jgi:hypothetical protein